MRVYPVVATELADRGYRLGGRVGHAKRLLVAAQMLELQDLAPHAHHEPAVAPARTTPAHVSLDENDVEVRCVLLQPKCRPETRETAPDDADIGVILVLERRSILLA